MKLDDEYLEICEACGVCESLDMKPGTMCASLSKQAEMEFEYPEQFPQSYSGCRFTSDAMDCSLPIALDSHSGCSYNCVAEGTKILMADGTQKPIQEIKIGDLVWTCKIGSDDRVIRSESGIVQRIAKRWSDDIMSISHNASTSSLRLTKDHLVFTNFGWKRADQITPGDEVLRVWKGNVIKSEQMGQNNIEEVRRKKTGGRKVTDHERHTKRKRMLIDNPMKNPETREKMSKISIELYRIGKRKPGNKYGMGNYSDGQRELYRILDKMGVPYEKEFSVKATPGCPNKARVFLDAAIPDKKIAIEYDGWPYHSWEKTKKKDQARDEWLKSSGWTIVRIAGDEIQDEGFVTHQVGIVLNNHRMWKKIKRVKYVKYYDKPLANGGYPGKGFKSGFVYDLQVSENHNFVAGGILVHNCLYCFSNNLQRAFYRNNRVLDKVKRERSLYTEWPIPKLEKFLAREFKDEQSKAMYGLLDEGAPVQLGALGDPFDDLELHSGWAKKAIPLFIKYGVPVRISTKGGLALQKPEYLKLFEESPDQFWIAWSTICNSDELIAKVDVNAPVTSERVAAVKKLSEIGCHTSLRFRPFLPGLSDSYPGEPEAWKVLMNRFAEAGARAISFEYIFLNSVLTPRQKAMYQLMFKAMGNPRFGDWWNAQSNPSETCRRGTRAAKYEMTVKIRDHAHKLGLQFGISDPHFKELNDSGSCCGMPESGDKWFSNWSRRQMTEVIVQARKGYEQGEHRIFTYEDWKPEWAHQAKLTSMVNVGNWHNWRRKKYKSFGDQMRDKWNSPKAPRGPYLYFGKVMVPIGVDRNTGDVAYEYREWSKEREGKTVLVNE